MSVYTITTGSDIIVRDDGIHIPPDQNNVDYQVYLAWVDAGNTAEILPEPHPTAAERLAMSVAIDLRRAKLSGAKVRAREITALSQAPSARTATAWTQPQRLLILDAIGDIAKMLSWLADDLLAVPDPPD